MGYEMKTKKTMKILNSTKQYIEIDWLRKYDFRQVVAARLNAF